MGMERRKEAIVEEGVLGSSVGTLRGMWGPKTEGKKKLCVPLFLVGEPVSKA